MRTRCCAEEIPDIVVVATPNDLHHPLTMAALDAGAEVMCEKPLALNVAQAAEMTRCAARLRRRTSVGFIWRFLPASIAMRALITSGTLGQIYHVELRYLTRGFGAVHGPMRWQYERDRAGSGALANLGSHAVDLLHWWFGDIKRVAAQTRTVIPTRSASATIGGRIRRRRLHGDLRAGYAGHRSPSASAGSRTSRGWAWTSRYTGAQRVHGCATRTRTTGMRRWDG